MELIAQNPLVVLHLLSACTAVLSGYATRYYGWRGGYGKHPRRPGSLRRRPGGTKKWGQSKNTGSPELPFLQFAPPV